MTRTDTCWNCGYFMPSAAFCSSSAPGGIVHKTNWCRMRYDRIKDPTTFHCASWYPKGINAQPAVEGKEPVTEEQFQLTMGLDAKPAPPRKKARMDLDAFLH